MFCTFLMQCVKVEQLVWFQHGTKAPTCTEKLQILQANHSLVLGNGGIFSSEKVIFFPFQLLKSSWESSGWLQESLWAKKSNIDSKDALTWHMRENQRHPTISSSMRRTPLSLQLFSIPDWIDLPSDYTQKPPRQILNAAFCCAQMNMCKFSCTWKWKPCSWWF